jgi:hypothetical protein
MARKHKLSMNWFPTADDTNWVLSYTYYEGFRGSYEDPPEGPEVNFETAIEELDKGFHGPCRVMSFDSFCKLYEVDDKDLAAMDEKAVEEAEEWLGDAMADEEDDDDYPEPEDACSCYDLSEF